MSVPDIDGVIFIPEMRDAVVLKWDLGPSIFGRPAVAATITRLEALYQSHEVIFQVQLDIRDIRVCRAVLRTGLYVEILTVTLRDAHGWVSELHLSHDPVAPVKAVLANPLH